MSFHLGPNPADLEPRWSLLGYEPCAECHGHGGGCVRCEGFGGDPDSENIASRREWLETVDPGPR